MALKLKARIVKMCVQVSVETKQRLSLKVCDGWGIYEIMFVPFAHVFADFLYSVRPMMVALLSRPNVLCVNKQ